MVIFMFNIYTIYTVKIVISHLALHFGHMILFQAGLENTHLVGVGRSSL